MRTLTSSYPAKNDTIKQAISFADIVLVPVLNDFLSIVNLRSVFDYALEAGIGHEQLAIVKNCVNTLKTSTEVEHILDEFLRIKLSDHSLEFIVLSYRVQR